MTRRTNQRTLVVISIVLMASVSQSIAKVIYVDANAPGPTHNGSSWENAYKYLWDALRDSRLDDEIRVAEGVYKPDEDTDNPNGTGSRYASFWLNNGVAIKGGYAGYGQPEPDKRDPNIYESILSGDLGGNDIEVNDPCDLLNEPSRAENSYHIVFSMATDASAVLDGFVITGGNANRQDIPTLEGSGGGFCCDDVLPGSPTVTNCSFIANSAFMEGGAMANSGSFEECNPTLTNCTFSQNWAMWGGAMLNSGWYGRCNPILTNCTFTRNAAAIGGGLDNSGYLCNIRLKDCVFISNSANSGGGIYNSLNYAEVINCAFMDNTAQYGGCIYNRDNEAIVTDCTFSRNSAQNGGCVFNLGSSNIIQVNCLFNSNSADGEGGGMSNSAESSSTLANCIFTGNSSNRGGGTFNDIGGNVILANCTLSGNKANYGGAICSQNVPPEPPPSNQGHKITYDAIWEYTQSETYNESKTVDTITNCILWANEAPNGPQIYLGPNSISLVSYCDVQGGEKNVYLDAGSILNWGIGNIDTDPCFVQPGYWEPVIIPLPGQATEPNPPDGATNVSVIADLSWTADSNATSHDVYFGTTIIPPFVCNQTSTTFEPGTLAYSTNYYWRIDELNIGGKTTGQTWSFTTQGEPPQPPPLATGAYSYTLDTELEYIWIEGDYHLQTGSPCVNAGDSNYKIEPNETDFDGKPRLFRARIDMGAYELHSPGTIYVDGDADGDNNGSSWANAYNYLQDALITAWNGDEIRVAQGIYKPDKSDYALIDPCDQAAAFKLKSSVTVKGGYAGFGESDPNARDISSYQTILSGDLNGNDVNVNDPCDLLTEPTRADNSYHVVNASATDSNALFDGFTITGGNANGPPLPGYPYPDYRHQHGGAMYIDSGHANINNCIFIANSALYMGGGIYNEHSSQMLTNCAFIANFGSFGGGMSNHESNSTLTHCIYSENSATFGGGIYNDLSNPTLTNCTFTSNLACPGEARHAVTLSGTGGGIFNSLRSCPTLNNCTFSGNVAKGDAGGIFNFGGSNLILTNCTFTGNVASHSAGAMYNWRNSPTIANCTFSSNSAIENGGSIYNEGSEATLTNCILWADVATEGKEIYLDLYVNYQGIEYPSTMNVNYSDVDGGITGVYIVNGCMLNWGEGNIDADPCFVDSNNGDYHLKSQAGRWDPNSQSWVRDDVTSPCIDAGNPGCLVGEEPSPNGNRINMGAYGGTAEASKSPAYWRSIADLTNDWIVDTNDLKVFADYWLQTGECLPGDFDRSQFVDFNDFAILGGQWQEKGPGPGITYDIGGCIPVDLALSAVVESEPTRFTVTVEGRYIYFEDMMRANCCPEELDVQMTLEADLITIYEIERFFTRVPCPCLCDFPITATFGPFEPGTYILEVYQDGCFIGTTIVTIDPDG